jgi:hypothetical protein
MSIAWGLKYYGSSTTVLNVRDYNQQTFRPEDQFVEEEIPVDVTETTAALLDAKLVLLHSLSGVVSNYQQTKEANQPVYFTATVDGTLWRSELVSLVITNESGSAFTYEHASFSRSIVMHVVRRPWETDTQYAAQVRSASSSDWATTAKVYGGDDRSGSAGTIRSNYLFVKENATAPAMNMKTPVKIVYVSPTSAASPVYFDEFYISTKTLCAAAGTENFTNALMAEGNTGETADTTCSGDGYYPYTFTATGGYSSADTIVLTSVLGQENKYYKAILRLRDTFVYTDLYCRVVLEDGTFTGNYIWYGDWYYLAPGENFYSLDSLKIPPKFLYDDSYVNYSRTMKVRLEFKSVSASARTINVDFVQFIGADAYAEIRKQASYSSLTTTGLTMNDVPFAVDFSTTPASALLGYATPDPNPVTGYVIWTVKGGPVEVYPSIASAYTTAIFFHTLRTTGLHYPDDMMNISIYYRPRRRAI